MSDPNRQRDQLIGETFDGYTIVGHHFLEYPMHEAAIYVEGNGRLLTYRWSYLKGNDAILATFRQPRNVVPKKRAFVLGNGPSLVDTNFELLKGETTYAVNRIWKMFDKTDWRPTHYVRGEMKGKRKEVAEDLVIMEKESAHLYLMSGLELVKKGNRPSSWELFAGCWGGDHAWHLPLICAYGTVVHIAMQLAVRDGAQELYLLGCDLGDTHFYDEPFENDMAYRAHEVAAESCPVPVYNCTPGGFLNVYPRRDLVDVCGK